MLHTCPTPPCPGACGGHSWEAGVECKEAAWLSLGTHGVCENEFSQTESLSSRKPESALNKQIEQRNFLQRPHLSISFSFVLEASVPVLKPAISEAGKIASCLLQPPGAQRCNSASACASLDFEKETSPSVLQQPTQAECLSPCWMLGTVWGIHLIQLMQMTALIELTL